MSLQNAIIKSGATWTPTGGVDLAFVPDGKSLSDAVNLVVLSDTNLLTRRSLTARALLPAAPTKVGDYAKLGRNSVTYRLPFIAADGKMYTQTVKLETAFHAEYTPALKQTATNDGAAMFVDADFANFWQAALLS